MTSFNQQSLRDRDRFQCWKRFRLVQYSASCSIVWVWAIVVSLPHLALSAPKSLRNGFVGNTCFQAR